jgi:pentafunctional AROM polypeptide
VENCGSDSIQEDAIAFPQILRSMGCKIVQTSSSTSIDCTASLPLTAQATPIDMGRISDCFMTLAVVSATANGITCIINVEVCFFRVDFITRKSLHQNQRKKESNRISAMVRELQKCGIDAEELQTGIKICGNPSLGLSSSMFGVKIPFNLFYIHIFV